MKGAMLDQLEMISEVKRPPLRYHGGKFRLAPWIIGHLPAHCHYVEVFGGGAGVLLRKPRSRIEVWNDLDSQVFNFFQVLRDGEKCSRLCDLISLTAFSRDEFDLSFLQCEDAVEAARRFVVRTHMGHGTSSMDPSDSNGFRSCDIRAGKSYAREWLGIPDAVRMAAERMRGVTLENLDFRKLIPKFDDVDTLFYVDPPYMASTRDAGGKGYVHELSEQDHRQLLWLLKGCKGKVALSGYSCGLYEEALGGWRRAQKVSQANGQRGAVSRVECLWLRG